MTLLTQELVERVSRIICKHYQLDDGFSQESADRAAAGAMGLNFRHVAKEILASLPTDQSPQELVERVARAIDPDAWKTRDSDMERRDEWEAEIKIGWGETTFEHWASRFVRKSLEQANRVLAALPTAQAADQWEGIESAPKDGTMFLAWTISRGPGDHAPTYRHEIANWRGNYFHAPWGIPIKWRPLPPPPAGEE